MNISIKNSIWGIAVMLVASGWTMRLFAQKETESIEKYRIVYNYEAPEIAGGDEGGPAVPVRIAIPRDSMGVYYNYDQALSRLISLHRKINENSIDGPGFRIQIYAGSKMETANEAKSDFLQSFRTSNMDVYKDWNPPHFWVRVGDFLSRNEAMKQLPNVRQVFPDAFVVQDKIKMPKYKKQTSHD